MANINAKFSKNQIHVRYNVGCLFDIPTGTYYSGKDGESILSGGYPYLLGICGKGNTYKSTVTHYMNLAVADRYMSSGNIIYDTEFTVDQPRLTRLAQAFENLKDKDLFAEEAPVLGFLDGLTSGNEFFEMIKEHGKEMKNGGKKVHLTTPFVDPKSGQSITKIKPTFVEIDSFSQFPLDTVEEMYSDNEIGDSKLNMEAMQVARLKSQMITQLPLLTAGCGIHVTMTAHVGKKHQLDPRKPPAKELAAMPADLKLKRVPENFTTLVNGVFYCSGTTTLQSSKKTTQYPVRPGMEKENDQDLQIISVTPWRMKGGASAVTFKVICSQENGLLPHLSQYHHLKENKIIRGEKHTTGFGLNGNDQTHELILCPGIKIGRTNIRKHIDENPKIRRALEITSEMSQIFMYWDKIDPELRCTPEQLYKDIQEKGYDWDVLLNTRGYWLFKEQKHPQHFLSTMDLLNMRLDRYKPKWCKPTSKKK
ncbi:hypothetical protein [Endozoicomonas sp. ONNA1]|uniref:hypothetical protein n=1 Tax=Endozoicomonas sp. ONNA1 TaxID=2828740 RepID=UPI00214892AA|nr:hypothetical protein [Endozoicomonas sp. ONNA1]